MACCCFHLFAAHTYREGLRIPDPKTVAWDVLLQALVENTMCKTQLGAILSQGIYVLDTGVALYAIPAQVVEWALDAGVRYTLLDG